MSTGGARVGPADAASIRACSSTRSRCNDRPVAAVAMAVAVANLWRIGHHSGCCPGWRDVVVAVGVARTC